MNADHLSSGAVERVNSRGTATRLAKGQCKHAHSNNNRSDFIPSGWCAFLNVSNVPDIGVHGRERGIRRTDVKVCEPASMQSYSGHSPRILGTSAWSGCAMPKHGSVEDDSTSTRGVSAGYLPVNARFSARDVAGESGTDSALPEYQFSGIRGRNRTASTLGGLYRHYGVEVAGDLVVRREEWCTHSRGDVVYPVDQETKVGGGNVKILSLLAGLEESLEALAVRGGSPTERRAGEQLCWKRYTNCTPATRGDVVPVRKVISLVSDLIELCADAEDTEWSGADLAWVRELLGCYTAWCEVIVREASAFEDGPLYEVAASTRQYIEKGPTGVLEYSVLVVELLSVLRSIVVGAELENIQDRMLRLEVKWTEAVQSLELNSRPWRAVELEAYSRVVWAAREVQGMGEMTLDQLMDLIHYVSSLYPSWSSNFDWRLAHHILCRTDVKVVNDRTELYGSWKEVAPGGYRMAVDLGGAADDRLIRYGCDAMQVARNGDVYIRVADNEAVKAVQERIPGNPRNLRWEAARGAVRGGIWRRTVWHESYSPWVHMTLEEAKALGLMTSGQLSSRCGALPKEPTLRGALEGHIRTLYGISGWNLVERYVQYLTCRRYAAHDVTYEATVRRMAAHISGKGSLGGAIINLLPNKRLFVEGLTFLKDGEVKERKPVWFIGTTGRGERKQAISRKGRKGAKALLAGMDDSGTSGKLVAIAVWNIMRHQGVQEHKLMCFGIELLTLGDPETIVTQPWYEITPDLSTPPP